VRARHLRLGLLAAAGAVVAGTLTGSGVVRADAQSYTTNRVGAYGGEPSIASDNAGTLYDTSPSDSIVYRSTDHGVTWTPNAGPDSSGDDCVTTDESGAVYWCNLNGSEESAPLQVDVWKSLDQGAHWTQGQSQVAGDGGTCGASCSPAGVDRQWTTAWIPPGKTTSAAQVAVMYHDFYGPSQIWVNVSKDGGATYGPPTPVLLNPAHTQAGVTGSATGLFYQECNTVPTGIQTVRSGEHAGRMYVSWIAADAVANATGCDISQDQAFHTLWVAWSDDAGATWTTQLAFDAGVGHDSSSPFAAFTIDDAGNPYIGFTNNLNADPAKCTAESTAGGATLQGDPSCEYDMYVVWSPDGGVTWDGGGGLVPGSAATPYRVNPVSETGSHLFPAIAAGQPGQVDVAYLRSPTILPTGSAAPGKEDPGACSGKLPNQTTACVWNLYAAQSTDLTQPPDKATWSIAQVTTSPVHVGDICNLGIACVPTLSDRNLLDFISEAIDPTTGCAHIAYPDDATAKAMMSANQTAGCLQLAPPVSTPEVPVPALLLLVGLPATWLAVRRGRRKRELAVS
jgi:hypothetical protein